jgi:hypothetical protein
VTKFLTSAALVLALASIPFAANARTNVQIGVAVGTPVYGGGYYRGGGYYDEGSVRSMLWRQGYRVDYIDRRGGAYFVRVYYGPDLYEGLIGCNDGRWLRRDRVEYRRWDRDRDWRRRDRDGDRDRDWNRDRDRRRDRDGDWR